jgi:hypothetical protein
MCLDPDEVAGIDGARVLQEVGQLRWPAAFPRRPSWTMATARLSGRIRLVVFPGRRFG